MVALQSQQVDLLEHQLVVVVLQLGCLWDRLEHLLVRWVR